MRLVYRIAVAVALAWLAVVLVLEGKEEYSSKNPDNIRLVLLFGGTVLLGVAAACVIGFVVLPAVGDKIGSAFFNPGEQIEKDVHADAVARMAQGDYEGAVAEYRATLDADPEDLHALSEIVRVYCEKMHEPEAAAKLLEEALSEELPPEKGAFLCARLVDVRWNYQHDAESARYLLHQIIETMPETKQAANATHRLHEIDRALAQAQLHGHAPHPPLPGDESEAGEPLPLLDEEPPSEA